MCRLPASVVLCLLAVAAEGRDAVPSPGSTQAPLPAPGEAVVFADHNYRGDWMLLKIGDEVPDLGKVTAGNWDRRISSLLVGAEAIVVVYSSPRFRMFCLALPGHAGSGLGYYPDLAKVKHDDLPLHLGDRVRSLRVVSIHTDPASLCRTSTRD